MEETELTIKVSSGGISLTKKFFDIRDDVTMNDILNHLAEYLKCRSHTKSQWSN